MSSPSVCHVSTTLPSYDRYLTSVGCGLPSTRVSTEVTARTPALRLSGGRSLVEVDIRGPLLDCRTGTTGSPCAKSRKGRPGSRRRAPTTTSRARHLLPNSSCAFRCTPLAAPRSGTLGECLAATLEPIALLCRRAGAALGVITAILALDLDVSTYGQNRTIFLTRISGALNESTPARYPTCLSCFCSSADSSPQDSAFRTTPAARP